MLRFLSARTMLIAFLLSAFFISFPDEGTAATKRTGGVEYQWKVEVGERFTANPGNGIALEDYTPLVIAANAGNPNNPGPTLPHHEVLSVINPDPLGFGIAASMDVFHDGAPGSFPPSSFYHLTLDFTATGTPQSGTATLGEIQNGPSNPATLDRQYWEADSLIQLPGSPASLHTLIGETNTDQPGLLFSNLHIQPMPSFSPSGQSFFDIFVEIQYDGSAPIDPAQPIFWLTTGAQVPEPTCLALASALTIGMLGRRRR